MGRRPSFASAKSASVHLRTPIVGGGGGGGRDPAAAGGGGGRGGGRPRSCRRRRGGSLHPDVSFRSGVGAAGSQGIERIDDERKRLKVDSNLFNGFRRSEFVDGVDGENRLTLVEWLHSEGLLTLWVGMNHRAIVGEGIGRGRKFVGGENRLHARHGERLANVKMLHAGVWQGAEQQFAVEHAVGVIILGVLCQSRDLGIEVSGFVVLANQFVAGSVDTRGSLNGFGIFTRHGSPPSSSRLPASSRLRFCRSPGTGRGFPRGPAPARFGWDWDLSSGILPRP